MMDEEIARKLSADAVPTLAMHAPTSLFGQSHAPNTTTVSIVVEPAFDCWNFK